MANNVDRQCQTVELDARGTPYRDEQSLKRFWVSENDADLLLRTSTRIAVDRMTEWASRNENATLHSSRDHGKSQARANALRCTHRVSGGSNTSRNTVLENAGTGTAGLQDCRHLAHCRHGVAATTVFGGVAF